MRQEFIINSTPLSMFFVDTMWLPIRSIHIGNFKLGWGWHRRCGAFGHFGLSNIHPHINLHGIGLQHEISNSNKRRLSKKSTYGKRTIAGKLKLSGMCTVVQIHLNKVELNLLESDISNRLRVVVHSVPYFIRRLWGTICSCSLKHCSRYCFGSILNLSLWTELVNAKVHSRTPYFSQPFFRTIVKVLYQEYISTKCNESVPRFEITNRRNHIQILWPMENGVFLNPVDGLFNIKT